jgi:hypothetical protein
MITFRGYKFDQSTVDKVKLAEAWLGWQIEIVQGSYSSGVSASAGTHDGGGAMDVHCNSYPYDKKVSLVHWLRAVGFAAWHRPPNWDGAGGSEHIHCEEIDNPNLSSGAKAQITQWNQGRNGLAGAGLDNVQVDVAAGRPARITQYPTPPQPPVVIRVEGYHIPIIQRFIQ